MDSACLRTPRTILILIKLLLYERFDTINFKLSSHFYCCISATTLALSQALHMIYLVILCTIDDFMAKKSSNMIERMMDPNIIDYYMISCAIPSIITIENRYQIDFGKPV